VSFKSSLNCMYILFSRWSTKVGIFGGTVYLVTANGLWSNNEEYSSIRALQDIRENADKKLGIQYLSKVIHLNLLQLLEHNCNSIPCCARLNKYAFLLFLSVWFYSQNLKCHQYSKLKGKGMAVWFSFGNC